jgi:hypothetical protein
MRDKMVGGKGGEWKNVGLVCMLGYRAHRRQSARSNDAARLLLLAQERIFESRRFWVRKLWMMAAMNREYGAE